MPIEPLSHLSDREKGLLRLLAQGHTVKTACSVTGDSVHAANELLRSARRKLGLSSSREAARWLAEEEQASQENRHTKIGIEPGHKPSKTRHNLAIGGIMIAILLAATAIVPGLSTEQSKEAELETRSASDRPTIVTTTPADGSVIPVGIFELSVTFDRPMLTQYAIYPVRKEVGDYLDCIGSPGGVQHSEDKRTFTMQCNAVAGEEYAVRFGSEQKGYFKDTEWRNAVPYVLSFSVRAPAPIADVERGQ